MTLFAAVGTAASVVTLAGFASAAVVEKSFDLSQTWATIRLD